MVSLNLICRLCLVNAENDCNKLLIKLTDNQKSKFEELTELELPLTNEYPLNVCTDCSDHLENFYFFKNQLIRKQNDLNLYLCTIKSESQEHDDLLNEAIQGDFIEFDDEIEIFDETNELLSSNNEDIVTENIVENNENLINDQIPQYYDNKVETVVCREELKFEKTTPQLILTPKFLYARDTIRNAEQISSDLESPLIDVNDKISNKCSLCNISFLSAGELELHLKDHDIKRVFECKACNINLSSKLAYEKHLRDNHEQKSICQICGNIYSNKRDLRSHLRSHNFDKKYKCNQCDKAFRHHHHLINHSRVHTKKSPFSCSECNQTFRQKYALTLHIKKHRKEFIECSTCKSQFIRPIQLKKHIENNLCDGTFKPYVTRTKKNKIN